MPNITAQAEYHFTGLSVDQVYAAWLDPDMVRRWMVRNLEATSAGPSAVTSIEIDPVVGGRYRFAGQQDGQQSDAWGYYRELDPGRRLIFTWFVDEGEEKEDNSTVTLELEPVGTGTHATMSHEMDSRWAEYAPQTANAWRSMLKAIEDTLAGARR
jgi:uncharacterized protein YndB with AHSA1/START domain